MKKYILLPAMMVAAMLSTTAVKAQEDVNPLLKYVNKENDLKASIGGRMFADVAYYHTEWTPMKSGAAITDARIHASLTYGKLFIYADFGFGNGEFSQKNLFAQYTFKESLKGIHLENPLKVVPLIHSNLTPVKFSHSPFCLFLFSSYSSCPLCRVLH